MLRTAKIQIPNRIRKMRDLKRFEERTYGKKEMRRIGSEEKRESEEEECDSSSESSESDSDTESSDRRRSAAA